MILNKKNSYTPFVSVVIPTYKDSEKLSGCLLKLSQQSYLDNRFEVIVVNNDSDSFVELRPNIKNFTILNEQKPGSYAARNTGLEHAKGDIIAFIDSDCLPEQQWIENGVQHLLSRSSRVAGKVCLYYKDEVLSYAEIYEKAFAFDQYKNVKNGCSVTANLFVHKSHILFVGPFNEALFSGGDFEWNKRASAAGLSIYYAEDVIVWHPARSSITELKNKVKRTARNGYNPYSPTAKSTSTKIIGVVRSLSPPIKSYKELYSRHDMSFREKLIAGVLAYYLKLYTTYQRFLTKWVTVQKVRG